MRQCIHGVNEDVPCPECDAYDEKWHNVSRLSQLEERVARLEKALGGVLDILKKLRGQPANERGLAIREIERMLA